MCENEAYVHNREKTKSDFVTNQKMWDWTVSFSIAVITTNDSKLLSTETSPEDGGNKILRNIDILPHRYTTLQRRILKTHCYEDLKSRITEPNPAQSVYQP